MTNNSDDNNMSSLSNPSKKSVDKNNEILSNSYSYDLQSNCEPDSINSKFYINSNTQPQPQKNSLNSSRDLESQSFSLKNQSRSCHNLSNANFNIEKNISPNINTKEQKSGGNFFVSKFKGIKKGVEKLYNSRSKKRTEINSNDIISSSNHSLSSFNSHSTLISNLGTSNHSKISKKTDTNNSENRLSEKDYQHQQSTSEFNPQNSLNSGKSTTFTDDETDDSESGRSDHSYRLKYSNGESNSPVVTLNQSRSLQETINRKVKSSTSDSSNLQVIYSKLTQPCNYLDKEDHIELNKKLASISITDRIWLQKKGFELLLQQAEAKRAEIVSLKADIDELNKSLVDKREPVRSQFEIESLRGEIRELANEKCKIEMEISKKYNKWDCTECKFENECDSVQCVFCFKEKDVSEIFICLHCGTKNALSLLSCKKCNAYLAESNNDYSSINEDNQRERRSSSNVSTNSNNSSQNVNSPTTPSSRNHTHNSLSSSSSLNSAFSQNPPIHTNLSSPFSTTSNPFYIQQHHPSIPFVATSSNSTNSGIGFTPQIQPNQNLPPRSPRMHPNIFNSHQNYNGISNNGNNLASLPPPYIRSNTSNGQPISSNSKNVMCN